MRLIFESSDRLKQTALSNVRGPHPFFLKPKQMKKLNKKEFFFSDCLSAGMQVFSCL